MNMNIAMNTQSVLRELYPFLVGMIAALIGAAYQIQLAEAAQFYTGVLNNQDFIQKLTQHERSPPTSLHGYEGRWIAPNHE